MVKLNKIYTRTGDDGQTVLVGGQRVAKHAKRPIAFGEIDELNSVIGITRNFIIDTEMDTMLARIQNDLFDWAYDRLISSKILVLILIKTPKNEDKEWPFFGG